MAIDFGGVGIADNYQTVFVPKINEAVKGLASMLDPAVIGYTGTPFTGSKRLNAGKLESFNGTSWAQQVINGLTMFSGDPYVGIGGYFYVNATVRALRVNSVSEGGQIELCRSSDNTPGWAIDALGAGASTSLRITDVANATTRMEFNSSGVGIGVTPAYPLHVNGNGKFSTGVLVGSSGHFLYQSDTQAATLRVGTGTFSYFAFVNQAGIPMLDSVSSPLRLAAGGVKGLTLLADTSIVAAGGQMTWENLAGLSIGPNIGTGNPGLAFDSNDFIDYDRAANKMRFSAGAYKVNITTWGLGVNAEAVASSTAVGFFGGDIVMTQATRAIMGNLYFTTGFKHFENGSAGAMRFGVDASTSVELIYTATNAGGAGAAATAGNGITLKTNGNVGINKFSPTRKLEIDGGAMTSPKAVAFSGTPNFDLSTSNFFVLATMTANVTAATFANAVEGQFFSVRVRQDATGGRTFAPPAGTAVAGSINTGPNKTSYLNLAWNATDGRFEGNWLQVP